MSFSNPLPGVPDVESPFFEEIFAAKDVPDDVLEVARFMNRNGYAVVDLPEPDLDRLIDEAIAGVDRYYDWSGWRTGELDSLRVIDAWKLLDSVRQIAVNEELLKLLATLYGRAPIPFQTLNFPVGTQQSFHTDAVHFHSEPARFMCGVWVAFEDIDDDNGPLRYYPGSHKLPIYSNHHVGAPTPPVDSPYDNYHLFERAWTELTQRNDLKAETFHARKGQALIWSANLLHGGARQNDLKRTRHSQVTHYYFEDCCYYTPLLSNPFAGQIYYRDIVNVATGDAVANCLNGAPVPREFIEACRP